MAMASDSSTSKHWPHKTGWALITHVPCYCGDRRRWLQGPLGRTNPECWGVVFWWWRLSLHVRPWHWVSNPFREVTATPFECALLHGIGWSEGCLMWVSFDHVWNWVSRDVCRLVA